MPAINPKHHSTMTISAADHFKIIGTRTHNLKNITVEIPRDQLVVVTGRSGSGKSSLAFDTLYAEGQRQYVESLSIYSRQFFNQLPRADVDLIEGLQPTLCLDQNNQTSNRRSTVGTISEVYDFLRVLVARAGEIHCYGCDQPIRQQTPQQIRDAILALPERTKVMIMAPMVAGQTGAHKDVLKKIRREGLVRVRLNGDVHDIDQLPEIFPTSSNSIDAVTDRIIVRDGIEPRLLESIDNAVRMSGGGQVICSWLEPVSNEVGNNQWQEKLFSTRYACPDCDINYAEVQPRTFSFNSPFGACKNCSGIGRLLQFDPKWIVDRSKSLDDGAITAWDDQSKTVRNKNTAQLLANLEHQGISHSLPLNQLTDEQWEIFYSGRDKGRLGLNTLLLKELATTSDEDRLDALDQMQDEITCLDCGGARVAKVARSVFIAGIHIGQIVDLSIDDAADFFASLNDDLASQDSEDEELKNGERGNGGSGDAGRQCKDASNGANKLTSDQAIIAKPLVKEICHRLRFLQKVGVGYLTLGRSADTLSGGEHQRVRLASSIGSGVTNVCFVLDEPSIGLHQRDNDRLILAIRDLQKSGNSLVVVEHDESIIRQSDHVIDMGPGAGRHGGMVVAQGSPKMIADDPDSLTGRYLSGAIKIETPTIRRPISNERVIKITGATGNNLQSVDVDIPLGVLCCVTGVSGSGKSTLINHTLAPAIARQLELVVPSPHPHSEIVGVEQIDKLILVDQKPIGRTPRACPATYSGIFDEIRRLFAATKMAKQRGYGIGRFTFNSKSGWCTECQGHGVRRMKMNFMPDVFVTCELCIGKRFNPQTLQVRFGELTIADVLDMTIEEALEYFDGFSKIRSILRTLNDVGLGYLKLGQPSTTLSGGEAQRVKLATELAKSATGNTLYILDEPTTGLHFEDIRVLIDVLNRLVDKGNSIIVIEHNLDVVRCADWIIDLGPEGGSGGGRLVGAGTPEEIAKLDGSHTGRYLRDEI
ncbi:MAG: excinuclease ABC subunit UvrA [Mariniblastus sp.]